MTDHPTPPDVAEDVDDQCEPSSTTDEPGASDGDTEAFETLAGMVADLSAVVRTLQAGRAAELEELTARIEELEADLGTAPAGPWLWDELSTEDRSALWQELYEWVSWLEDRYLRNLAASRLTPLHADWYRNPVAVELFTSLMVAHQSAYRRKAAAPSFALVEWHDRCLWPTLNQMVRLGVLSDVEELHGRDWDGPDYRTTRRSDDRFDAFVDGDLAAHHIDVDE